MNIKKLIKILYPIVAAAILGYIFLNVENTFAIAMVTFTVIFMSIFIYDIMKHVFVWVSLLMGSISIVAAPLLSAFQIHHVCGFALVILFFLNFILLLTTFYTFKYSENYRLATLMRKNSIIATIALFVISIVLCIIGEFNFSSWLNIILYSVALIVYYEIVPDSVKKFKANRHLFSYPIVPNFILYLRKFTVDGADEDTDSLKILSSNSLLLKVIRIMKPKKIWDSYKNYDYAYLPYKNWQDVLDNYIKSARLVFAQIDCLDGVVWEIFKNGELNEKYIYFISQTDSMASIIPSIEKTIKSPNYKDLLLDFFRYICNNNELKKLAFCIEPNRIIYSSELNDLLEYKLRQETSNNLLYYYPKINIRKEELIVNHRISSPSNSLY